MAGRYLLVRCSCGSEKTVFSHATSIVKCDKCREALAHPSGGEAVIHGEVVKELG